ncbi:MAG: relaxase/mobilization nuclease domain-containing protein [Cyanobacteria bacterium J06621_12]
MIAKQVKGKSFRGVLNYLHLKEGSRMIGGNMAGDTPRIMSAEFAVSRQLNPKLSKAVYHCSLSLPKSEHLDDDTWNQIAEEYLLGMEFNDSQYVLYRHSDKDHDHVHIVASRIRITDGTTVSDSWDYVRSEKQVRELEHKYELTPTISSQQKQQRGQTTGEMRLIERTGEESVRVKLQQAIDEAAEKPNAMPEFVNCLKDQGIDAKITVTRTGKIKGISYQSSGVAISGTHLGRAYTFPGLQKYRQVSYDHNLHYHKLIQASQREPSVETIQQRAERNKQIEQATSVQRERSLIIAPILRDYINEVRQAKIETPDYRISWHKEEQTLYLYKDSEAEPRLKIKYQNQEFKPIEPASSTREKQPMLTSADVNYWQQFAIRLHQAQEQKKKQAQIEQQKKQDRGRGFSR